MQSTGKGILSRRGGGVYCLNRDSLDYGMTLMKKKKDKESQDNPQIK